MLRKFKLEDLDDFIPQKEQCIGSEWDKRVWIHSYLIGCEMYTAEDAQGVIGFCSFVPDAFGNETFCIVFSDRKRAAAREMILLYDLVFMNRPIKRTQAFVKRGWGDAARFATHFCFKHEGTLKNFGRDGEDYDVYAIVRGAK